MMKRIVALLACAGMAGCGGGDSAEEGTGFPRGVTATTITIGSQNDLSGPLAIWGVPLTNGMRMRFAELNDAGGVHGRKIEFIVEDAGSELTIRTDGDDADEALQAVAAFLEETIVSEEGQVSGD